MLHAYTAYGAARSADDGASWEPVAFDLSRTERLVVAPSSAGHVYAKLPGALLRSEDGGAHFELAALPVHDPGELAVSPTDPRVLYTAPQWPGRGLHRSSDGGRTWTALAPALSASRIVLPARAPGTVWVQTREGLASSQDGGGRFEDRPLPTTRRVHTFDVSPADPRVAYALDESGGWYVTSDGGATWAAQAGPPGQYGILVLDPADPQALFLVREYGAIHRSVDGGRTFLRAELALPDAEEVRLAFSPAPPHRLYALVSGGKDAAGVYERREGGAGWEHLGKGLPPGPAWGLSFAASDPNTFFVRRETALYKTESGGR